MSERVRWGRERARGIRARARQIPRAAWTCALIATMSAACWSVITPPFQATDEPSHFAYAQYLAETGHLPTSAEDTYSPEESLVLDDLHGPQVLRHPEVKTIPAGAAQQLLQRNLATPLAMVGLGGAGVAAPEPPFFYAVETIPYYLGSGGTLLDQLELMRLLSALMAGLTALFTFMFVRETLPGVPWAWTVGGVAAAFAPALGFTSSVVTPDAMLYAVSAAIFYCLARAFRRGLSPKLAVAIGVLMAMGFLTKLNFVGLAPGMLLGLIVLGFRGSPDQASARRSNRAFGSMALAIAVAASPVYVYGLVNLFRHHPALGFVSGAIDALSRPGSLVSEAAYVWQFYLPRLPGMVTYFPGLSPTREIWFDRSVGFYGWLDTSFPVWVDNLALIPAALIAVLALRSLIVCRSALRTRIAELVVYGAIAVGLMALIGSASDISKTGAGWAQPRYLIPLLPLFATVFALAARGAGRRWGPGVGTLIVVLFISQDVFSQMLVVARFYG